MGLSLSLAGYAFTFVEIFLKALPCFPHSDLDRWGLDSRHALAPTPRTACCLQRGKLHIRHFYLF